MVTAIVSLFAATWVAGLIVLIRSARRAPVGVETEDGFHFVAEPTACASTFGAAISAS